MVSPRKKTNQLATPGKNTSGSKIVSIDASANIWEQIKGLARLQCTPREICSFLDLTPKYLDDLSKADHGKGFKDLIEEWSEAGKCSLRRKQWKLAETSATMAIWLGKQMLGQRDVVKDTNEFDGKLKELLELIKKHDDGSTPSQSETV